MGFNADDGVCTGVEGVAAVEDFDAEDVFLQFVGAAADGAFDDELEEARRRVEPANRREARMLAELFTDRFERDWGIGHGRPMGSLAGSGARGWRG